MRRDRVAGEPGLHKYALRIMLLCMRTTLDLNDDLLRRAKSLAAKRGVPLRRIVEDAIREFLRSRSVGPGPRYRLRWSTERGRIQPGVRLDDRDTLFDVMEGRR